MIPRKTPLPRESAKHRAQREAAGQPFGPQRAPIKRKKRRAAEDARIYGPREFRDYLHAHPCLGCGYRGPAIQQAHRTTGGTGRKSDWTETGPLCGPRMVVIDTFPHGVGRSHYPGCHTLHDDAKRSWRTKAGQTFAEAQRAFFAQWQQHAGRVEDECAF